MRKADRCQPIKGNGNCPLSFRLQHLPFAKMLQLKLFAALMTCLLLLSQVNGSPVPELASAKRSRRMTPFWRGVSLRPIGASCRDDSECITRLCRKRRCSLSVAQE
ncbi:liver-expressed antimicrobial peptide 2 [Cricetulus griseus]|uniref:Liver-expressed antimicrobial peptide 2 n=2 Tax=Cricetulus griseus TaxID=10029 RepID=A0A9J7GG65_CRIGR|nr:liver-expressed antimicrobial peptide 2 [Cricetulus griseus]XP_027283351.2 liver-expressed antimicrobial peptide 2 [Cricetulus griseus]